MERLFFDTRELDTKARGNFKLSEELMVENAAVGMEKCINEILEKSSQFVINKPGILILCGKGNNGADGYALARRLCCENLNVFVVEFEEPYSAQCVIQRERAVLAGIQLVKCEDLPFFFEQNSIDIKVVVDCIFGMGFHGILEEKIAAAINLINQLNENVKRVACDVPTGIDTLGNAESVVFKADFTVTMGAKKLNLYSDAAKDYVGQVILVDLGIRQEKFQVQDSADDYFLLAEEDFVAPQRESENANKGSFGHTAVFCGDKIGAGVICGKAALKFGSGLVTLVNPNKHYFDGKGIPFELMTSDSVPEKVNSVACGMGLGRTEKLDFICSLMENSEISFVLDADVFHNRAILTVLEKHKELQKNQWRENIVLTPHPKEFASLLNICGFGDCSVEYVIKNRLELVKQFCLKYKGVIVLLKGCNSVIGYVNENDDFSCYINPTGSVALAKAGSGDVLSGIIASLLAQKQTSLQAAINGSLAHSLASQKFVENYALTPFELIEKLN